MPRRLPVLVGASSFLLATAIAFLPADGPALAGTPSLPDRAPGYSYLTGDVSASPPGRAMALFQFGFGVETGDFPQAVVLGADADTVRRLDVAEDRAGPETQGDPAPMLLSPDGTRVAVGDHDAEQPDLLLVDLATGEVERFPLPDGGSSLPLAWSSDGGRLAYLTSPGPTNPYTGMPLTGDLGVLDVRTGAATAVPGASGVTGTAFSLDGTQLAVQRGPGELTVVTPDGSMVRTLDLPRGYRLDSASAWSPDGALLATRLDESVCTELYEPEVYLPCRAGYADRTVFVDATGAGTAVPAPLAPAVTGYLGVVGWTAPDRVLVLAGVDDPDPYRLTEISLLGGAPRVLTEIPTARGNFGVGGFQLATGLLPDLQIRDAGPVDRGPWPAPARAAVALALGLTAAAVVAVARRRVSGADGPSSR